MSSYNASVSSVKRFYASSFLHEKIGNVEDFRTRECRGTGRIRPTRALVATALNKAGPAYTAKRGKRLNRIGLGRDVAASAIKLVSVLWGLHHCTALSARQSNLCITAM